MKNQKPILKINKKLLQYFLIFILLLVIPNIDLTALIKNTESQSFHLNPSPKTNLTSLIVNKANAQASCNGTTSTTKSTDDIYNITVFGCSDPWNGIDGYTDPADNCIPAHAPPSCSSLTDPGECEKQLIWFAANTDIFGINKKIKVTNQTNSKSVVLLTIDQGPSCSEEREHGPLIDVSYTAAQVIGTTGNYEKVKVEPVPDSTPLGPTDANTTPNTSTSGNGSTILNLILRPKIKDGYIKNTVTTQILGAQNAKSNNAPNSSTNPDATCPGVGPITCGTASTPIGGCGHCSAEYQAFACKKSGGVCSYCQPPSNSAAYAIDITNPLDGPVYIPKLSINNEVHPLSCLGYANICLEEDSNCLEPTQIIQVVSCKDTVSGEAVWLQFHHSQKSNPLQIDKEYLSGDQVGTSAEFTSYFTSEPHVHFQAGIGGPCGAEGTESCVNANEVVSCG